MNTLYVANEIQKALFENELKGQLSDGMWENTNPHDHWQPWCRCQVVVRPTAVGRDFYAKKDNYNFSSKLLVECVGDRMLEIAQSVEPTATMKRVMSELDALKRIVKVKL
jgi:hypothetical protein